MISHKQLARIAGFLYLVVILTGLFAEVFVRQAMQVPGNAVATARNIQSAEVLYRWGLAADLVNFVCGLPVVLVVYYLFKRTNKFLLQLALVFVVIQTAVIAVNLLHQMEPLYLLGGHPYLDSFPPHQLAALSQLALQVQSAGYAIGLIFFGVYCLLVGYVVFRSHLVPPILGVLYAISGIGYLINSFVMILSKGFANPVFQYLAIPIFIGEFSFSMWLLLKGVKSPGVVDPND